MFKKVRFWFLGGCVLLLAGFAQADTQWIDVRSVPEHLLDSIEGDLRVSHTDIVEVVAERFPDKDTEIALYCRSGNRAGVAMEALQKAGYTQVTNAGGIEDARRARGISE